MAIGIVVLFLHMCTLLAIDDPVRHQHETFLINDCFLLLIGLFVIPAREQAELTTLGGAMKMNMRRTMLIDETLANDKLEGQEIEMATQKFGQIAHVSQERLDSMNAKTVAQELRDILDAEQELKSFDPSVADMSHQHSSLAETVSFNAPHVRLGGGSRITARLEYNAADVRLLPSAPV